MATLCNQKHAYLDENMTLPGTRDEELQIRRTDPQMTQMNQMDRTFARIHLRSSASSADEVRDSPPRYGRVTGIGYSNVFVFAPFAVRE